MNTIKIYWSKMATILAIKFNVFGYILSFGDLLLFSCCFLIVWFVFSKIVR